RWHKRVQYKIYDNQNLFFSTLCEINLKTVTLLCPIFAATSNYGSYIFTTHQLVANSFLYVCCSYFYPIILLSLVFQPGGILQIKKETKDPATPCIGNCLRKR